MNDNIDKNEIRRAIDRLQEEHPCHFAFDATKFDSTDSIDVVKRAIDSVMESIRDDADIHIICEMAKLYLDGVKPTVDRPRGEWISFSEGRAQKIKCSNCGQVYSWIRQENYCSICGSDNRKEGGEAE